MRFKTGLRVGLLTLGAGINSLVGYALAQRYIERAAAASNNEPLPNHSFAYQLSRGVPSRVISKITGRLAAITHPQFVVRAQCKAWAALFGCELGEAERDISEYKSLRSFFTRKLRPGSRPIDDGERTAFVAPADSVLTSSGIVDEDGSIVDVKGLNYRLADLLRSTNTVNNRTRATNNNNNNNSNEKEEEKRLLYTVFYLAPGDYHRFHAPCDYTIDRCLHVPGDLLPVLPPLLRFVPRLFATNERVVLEGRWRFGKLWYVPVGALNVGHIQMTHLPQLETNTKGSKPGDAPTVFPMDVAVKRGDELGMFSLGSTIVLVMEAPVNVVVRPGLIGRRVKVGEAIAEVIQAEKAA